MVLAIRHGVLGYEAMGLFRLPMHRPFGVQNYEATRGNGPAHIGTFAFTLLAPGFTAYYYKGSTGFDPPRPEWELRRIVPLARPSDAAAHPEIASLRRESGRFSVDVAGQAGWTYELQRKLSLTDATWQPAATRGPLTTSQGLELTDPDATRDEAIYRVQASPP